MTGKDLIELLDKSHRRSHITGTTENGIIAALDLEGRLFAIINGRVINRVVPSAIINRSNKSNFYNPGGDALWPAPEGTCFGYEYTTGKWRVPPSITGAVWEVISQTAYSSVIRAEADLVNNLRIGIPCELERHIEVELNKDRLIQKVKETIRYIGDKTLLKDDFRLAPWSLCQFDSGKGGKVIMPEPGHDDIRDLYSSSLSKRKMVAGMYEVDMETDFRFQLGLSPGIPWVEYIKEHDFTVKRYSGKLAPGQSFIDISDLPPDQMPSSKGVSLSVYCDPSGFMEMEACGGCPDILEPGTELSVRIITEYATNLNSKQ
jgi:hypothetical protein